MADQAMELFGVFKGAKQVFNVPDFKRFVADMKGISNLARDLREKAEAIRNDLEVNVSIEFSGEKRRKYGVPGEDSTADLKNAEDAKTDQLALPASTTLSPTPAGATTASTGADTGANPTNGTSTSNTVADADHTTETVPSEVGRDSTASGKDADGWICASCTFRNQPTVDVCEKCSTARNALEILKTQLEEIKQKTELVQPPSHWLPVDPGTRAKRVKLAENDEEYLTISKRMSMCCNVTSFFSMATVKRILRLSSSKCLFDIKKIERIENLHLYQMYSIRKAQMDEENSSVVANEQMLWHGTAPDCIDNITSYGFNRSLCGKNGTAFGKGVYFCTAPCYSSLAAFATPDKNGIQHMFYCRVLTGRYTAGKPKMMEPPMMLNNRGRYNSLTNCLVYPSIFVIFHDAQAYPEYLVTFKRQQ